VLPYQDQLTPQQIWNIAQNKPSLIADDLETYGVPRAVTHNILLARGVYKWLAVRRQLITLKDVWGTRLTQSYTSRKGLPPLPRAYQQGYAKALEECRAEVRALCHSSRWQAPDFDREAQTHLQTLEAHLVQA
jgi:hypothetical protein